MGQKNRGKRGGKTKRSERNKDRANPFNRAERDAAKAAREAAEAKAKVKSEPDGQAEGPEFPAPSKRHIRQVKSLVAKLPEVNLLANRLHLGDYVSDASSDDA